MINFVIPLEPVAKERARVGKHGAWTPPKTAAFEKACAMLVRAHMRGRLPMAGPLRLSLGFWFTRPAKPAHKYPSKCDLDNCVKSVSDSVNGILFEDDRQVIEIVAAKRFAHKGDPGFISIEVCEVTP